MYPNDWMRSWVDDGFGNLWEAAGSYYNDHPEAPMLHTRMMKMNYTGMLYHFGMSKLNAEGFGDGIH